jgi:hypothetical protein
MAGMPVRLVRGLDEGLTHPAGQDHRRALAPSLTRLLLPLARGKDRTGIRAQQGRDREDAPAELHGIGAWQLRGQPLGDGGPVADLLARGSLVAVELPLQQLTAGHQPRRGMYGHDGTIPDKCCYGPR